MQTTIPAQCRQADLASSLIARVKNAAPRCSASVNGLPLSFRIKVYLLASWRALQGCGLMRHPKGVEKPMDDVSADRQDHTFTLASAMVVLLKGASAIVFTVACFALMCYGSLALFDWIAG